MPKKVPNGLPFWRDREPSRNNDVVPFCVGMPDVALLPMLNWLAEAFQKRVDVFAVTVPLVSFINKIPPIGRVVVEKSGG